jgi:hypothetical protein
MTLGIVPAVTMGACGRSDRHSTRMLRRAGHSRLGLTLQWNVESDLV